MEVFTVYFNEKKHKEEIKIIEKAINLVPYSKSEFGFKAIVKEAKRLIKKEEKNEKK